MKLLSELMKACFPEIGFVEIKNVVMDSRKIEKNSLFLAIQGGNKYVEEALQMGASLVIADDYHGNYERVCKVENTILCIQELARVYRQALPTIVIAITGSNGKTTTKDISHAILSKCYISKKTLGNYNNHIGLPFTILNLDVEDRFAVLELGMSALGEIDLLGKISAPDYAIITNIGDSHLEFLKTRENVLRAKTELLKYVDAENVITSGDDIFLKSVKASHVGYEEGNEYQIREYQKRGKKTSFMVADTKYEIPLEGKHNVMNTAMSIVLALKVGMTEEEIQKNLQEIEMSPMRFERVVRGKTEYINDAYNASPISTMAALDSFEEIAEPCKIAILGDMLELGEKELEFHKDVLKKAIERNITEILLYGPRMKEALESITGNKEKIQAFESKEEIQQYVRQFPEKIILLKGSRGMKLEEIIEGE